MPDTIAENILKTFTPPADRRIHYIYLRSPQGKLVATVGVSPSHTDTHALWAIAVCNSKDAFSKLTGRLLVAIRLAKRRHCGVLLRGPGVYRRVVTAIARDQTRFCHFAIEAANYWLTTHPVRPDTTEEATSASPIA